MKHKVQPLLYTVPQQKSLIKVGGHYFNNCCTCKPSEEAKNPETAAELWKLSKRLVRQITLNETQVVDL
ncbi:hypothetical protein OS493_007653 [Desmophyllum pertusum]|uniref:Uncharacterized protein n=1 Tax=Desmophyllum pertusum TaxID=174260 RepID=A0A9W9YT01_9CNID|nr:hypothetical protein OS493_007653 [Desmophyllum pertusum]